MTAKESGLSGRRHLVAGSQWKSDVPFSHQLGGPVLKGPSHSKASC